MAEENGLAGVDGADSEFTLRQIKPGDKLTGLSLGDASYTPLKTFLQKKALTYQAQNLARTYGVFKSGTQDKIIAYITLICGEITVDGETSILGDDIEFSYKSFPAVKIARLAVHEDFRRYGIGRKLIDLGLGIAKDTICPAVGCRFVVVDSKREALDFYADCGFTILDTLANRTRATPVLFVDLHKLPTPSSVVDPSP